MDLSDFDYHLPKRLIAQSPREPRDSSLLMVLKDGGIKHKKFYDLPDYLVRGDVLVINNSKVLPARLLGKKKSGGAVDCLIVKQNGREALSLLKGKNLAPGTKISFEDGALSCIIKKRLNGKFLLKFDSEGVKKIMGRIGRPPIPPYIKKNLEMRKYQTIYAKHDGSIAAPTAGLHFTEGLIRKLKKDGIKIASLTLHIGPGTFSTVKAQKIGQHVMEPEQFKIEKRDANLINNRKGRLIAVGTTTVKALESACDEEGAIRSTSAQSGLFIHPPHKFRSHIDALLTNFHLPKSTLLMLVCAYAGKDEIFFAYQSAIKERYRFYSLGDAMLINHGAIENH